MFLLSFLAKNIFRWISKQMKYSLWKWKRKLVVKWDLAKTLPYDVIDFTQITFFFPLKSAFHPCGLIVVILDLNLTALLKWTFVSISLSHHGPMFYSSPFWTLRLFSIMGPSNRFGLQINRVPLHAWNLSSLNKDL